MTGPAADLRSLAVAVKQWGLDLGFQQVGITDTDLAEAGGRLREWVRRGYHGDMGYMTRHGDKRTAPAQLVPGTCRVISARMDYLPDTAEDLIALTRDHGRAVVSRYAVGRDYHKVLRKRLQRLADRIADTIGPFGYRVFVDSAPVMEKPLAQKAGLGWIGKHTNLVNTKAGSWFFLGEIYTDLPLPVDAPAVDHCGTCRSCIDVCPTAAIIAPYVLDARRCVSYLTIELDGPVPPELRPLIGNRIYGCDDCQAVCPWNRFARPSGTPDFSPRHRLDAASLLELFGWTEAEFLAKTEGSAIRRIGHVRWLRNIAVALGNNPPSRALVDALAARQDHPHPLVREHVGWALGRLASGSP